MKTKISRTPVDHDKLIRLEIQSGATAHDVSAIKSDVNTLKSDVNELKTDLKDVQTNVKSLLEMRTDVKSLLSFRSKLYGGAAVVAAIVAGIFSILEIYFNVGGPHG